MTNGEMGFRRIVVLPNSARLLLRLNCSGQPTLKLYQSCSTLPKGKQVTVGEKEWMFFGQHDQSVTVMRVFGCQYEYYVLCSDLPGVRV